MTVYCLFDNDGDDPTLLAIYATEVQARAMKARLVNRTTYVEKWEVEDDKEEE